MIYVIYMSICVLFLFSSLCLFLHWNKLSMRVEAVSVLFNTVPQSLEQYLAHSRHSVNIY